MEGYKRIYFSERVIDGNYTNYSDCWAAKDIESEALRRGPIPISEITQYLPKNHHDLSLEIQYEIY